MMVLPIVTQLWFARSEFVRCLEDVTAEDAVRRIKPMNCLSWIVGHLASQEHYLWLEQAQGIEIVTGLHQQVGYGSPPSTPSWDEMWAHWHKITKAADIYLKTISENILSTHPIWQGQQVPEDIGTRLLRNIYHYWFHIGEAHAIRQILGHPNLPQYVGNMSKVVHS
jgi:hypothetical protein